MRQTKVKVEEAIEVPLAVFPADQIFYFAIL
jgi:hypothetical protein